MKRDGEVTSFTVRGLPVPQGSARGFYNGGHVVITSANRNLSAWRRLVADVAQRHAPPAPYEGPVYVRLEFTLPRPKNEPTHRGRGKKRHAIRTYPARRPDLDKLVRAIGDSIRKIVYLDDAQVIHILAKKDWGVPGVEIEVGRVKSD